MLCSCFLSSVTVIITKHVVLSMPPLEVVFFRNFFAMAAMLPWAFIHGIPHIKAAKFRLYFLRSLVSLFAMSMFFYAISIVPLTDVIALTFTVPLLTTLFASIFLAEKVGLQRWLALLAGFAGVIVILRPGYSSFQYAYLMVLAATVAWSVSNILIKKTQPYRPPARHGFYHGVDSDATHLARCFIFLANAQYASVVLAGDAWYCSK